MDRPNLTCRHGEWGFTCYLCKVLRIEGLEAESAKLRIEAELDLANLVDIRAENASLKADLAYAEDNVRQQASSFIRLDAKIFRLREHNARMRERLEIEAKYNARSVIDRSRTAEIRKVLDGGGE